MDSERMIQQGNMQQGGGMVQDGSYRMEMAKTDVDSHRQVAPEMQGDGHQHQNHQHQNHQHHPHGDVSNPGQHAHAHQTSPQETSPQSNNQVTPVTDPAAYQQNVMTYNGVIPGFHHCHCYGHCRGQVPNTVYQNDNTLNLNNLTLSGTKLHLPTLLNSDSYAQPAPTFQNHKHPHPHPMIPQIQHTSNPMNIHMGVPDPDHVPVPKHKHEHRKHSQPPVMDTLPSVKEVVEEEPIVAQQSRPEAVEDVNAERHQGLQETDGTFPEYRNNNKREISGGFTGDSAKNLIYFQTENFYNQHMQPKTPREPAQPHVNSEHIGSTQSMVNLRPNTATKLPMRMEPKANPLKGARSLVTCGGEEMGGGIQEPEIVTQPKPETEAIGDYHANDAITKQFEKVEEKMKLLSKSRRLMSEQKASRRNGLE